MKHSGYLFTYLRIARSCIYYNPRDDSTTVYLGTRRSRNSFCAYDKKLELRARHAYVARRDRLRLEHRDRRRHSFADLYSLRNPFTDLLVADLRVARTLSAAVEWQRFLDQTEVDGAQRALGFYSLHRRRYFQGMLTEARAGWMDVEAIWHAWQQVLQEFERNMRGIAVPVEL